MVCVSTKLKAKRNAWPSADIIRDECAAIRNQWTERTRRRRRVRITAGGVEVHSIRVAYDWTRLLNAIEHGDAERADVTT
jgi:hypothetical protein